MVEPTNDGRVKIKSNLAGKLLDAGMSSDNGTLLQIWADVNGENQYWTINEVTRKPKTSVKASAVKAKAAAEKAATEIVDAAAVAVPPLSRRLPRQPSPLQKRPPRPQSLLPRRPSRLPSPVVEKTVEAAKPVVERLLGCWSRG